MLKIVKSVVIGGAVEQFKPKLKLISASAGTGKTYTLIQNINNVLKDTPVEKVVAITFTRAATRDIKNKVKDLGDINVNTIHGFFASILREQSIYFKQSANFKILEEFDESKLFKDTAVKIMLKKLGSIEHENFFAEYEFNNIIEMLLKMEKNYSRIQNKISIDEKELLKQEKQAQYNKLKELMPDNFEQEVIYPIKNFKGKDQDSLEQLRIQVLEVVKALRPVTTTNSFYDNIELFKSLIEYDNRVKGSKKNWDSEEEQLQVKTGLKRLNEIRNKILDYRLGENWTSEQASKFRKLFFELFLETHKANEQRKSELDVLSYNDIEIKTHELINKNPKVAKYYQDKYDYIFVDEFQDTNTTQRDVLFCIAKNVFVVGDPKQSIYRFRNADVRVFIDTQNKCNEHELEELSTNRRCLANIVEAVNTAFPLIFGHSHSKTKRKDFEANYLKFHPEKDKIGGIVKIINASSGTKHHNSFDHELEAKICLELINKARKEGRSYGDIALLFRASKHMSEFEKLFRDKGIPFVVYGGESRNDLLSSFSSLFNIILDPNDDLSMLEVLKLPTFYTSEQDIYSIKKESLSIWQSLEQSLDEHPIKSFLHGILAKKDEGSFTEFVTEVLRRSQFIQGSALMFSGQDAGAEEAILRAAMHVESEGEGIEYFLNFLYKMKLQEIGTKTDAVKLMTVHASKGLEFKLVLMPCLDNIPLTARDSIVISDDGDIAVKLGDDESNTKLSTVLYKDIKDYEEEADLAESKRLLYVAMTRAKDELYLISDFNKGNKGVAGKRWVDWIAEIFKDKIEEYQVQESANNTSPKRKILRTIKDPTLNKKLDKGYQEQFIQRYSVSFIRDSLIQYDKKRSSEIVGIGTIIHSLLENFDKKDELQKIYDSIRVDAKESISSVIEAFVSSDLGQRIFSAKKYLCEHSFIVKDQNKILSGRIDRINLYEDSVWVLDYKTAVEEKELPAYQAQIACYVKFAEKAFPNKKVFASIVDVTACKEYKV